MVVRESIKNKDMSLKQEILEKFDNRYIKALKGNEELKTQDIINLLLDIKTLLSSSLDRIIEKAKGCKPEERRPDDGYGDEVDTNRGFNEGISQFLESIKRELE